MTLRSKRVSRVRCLVLSLALLAGLCRTLCAADAAPKPEDLFPDTTFVAVALPDLSAARKAADSGRMGALFKQPEMHEFLDPLMTRMKDSLAELRKQNPMLPAFDDLDKSILSGEISFCAYSHGPGIPPGVFVSIKPKDLPAFNNILDPFKQILQDKPRDQPFPLGEGDKVPGVMLTKERLMLCFPFADMQAIVDRVGDATKRAKGTLASTANFKEARANMKDPAAWVYANPSVLIALAEEAAAANGGNEMEAAKVKVLLTALGVDRLTSILASLTFAGGEPGIETFVGADEAAASKGVFSLIGTKGPSKDLLQIAALDSPYVVGGSINFAGVMPLVRSVLTAVEPKAIEQLNAVIAQGNAMVKFDIEKDLLGNLEPEFVSAQTPNDTAMPLSFSPGMAGAMKLKNGAKFEECLAKLKALADENHLADRIPSLYMKFDTTNYKGSKIYYVGQILNGGMAMCVVKDKLIFGNSLNAVKRGLSQLSASSNISASKEFQTALARVGGAPFDVEKMPLSFAFATDRGSGGGVLLMTMLGIGTGTATLAGIAEGMAQGQEIPVNPAEFMPPLDELAKHAGGRTALKILNGADMSLWPDEEFFIKYRQAHASIGLKSAKGWMSRTEFPPPMPQYGSMSALVPVALAAVLAGSITPAFARARGQARQAQGMNNLHQIHKAILMYEIDKNAYPSNPADLFPTYIDDIRVFKNAATPNEDASYILITGVTADNALDVLAYENIPAGTGKSRSVLLAGGAVETMSEEDFQQSLKLTEANVKKAGKKFAQVPMSVKEISKKKKE